MTASAMSVGISTPAAERNRASHRPFWLLAFGAVAALTAARLPAVADHLRSEVEVAIANGTLQDTTQRDLAVNIGLVTAFTMSLVVVLVVMAVARRFETRLRLPVLSVAGRPASGTLVVVATVLVAKQAACLATGTTDPRTDPVVWSTVLLALAGATALVARQATARPAVLRTLVVALAVGTVTIVI